MIIGPRHDADKAFLSFQCHRPAIVLEPKQSDLGLDADSLGRFG